MKLTLAENVRGAVFGLLVGLPLFAQDNAPIAPTPGNVIPEAVNAPQADALARQEYDQTVRSHLKGWDEKVSSMKDSLISAHGKEKKALKKTIKEIEKGERQIERTLVLFMEGTRDEAPAFKSKIEEFSKKITLLLQGRAI